MKAEIISELPLPPKDKKGWPWTRETLYDEKNYKLKREDLPRISIVTPSYNQGEFIEETIRSVLLQNYPNLEYIIVDGGSSDESMKVINKYRKWIDVVISGKDSGQSDAINKGLQLITGDIFNWLNSDDSFEPSAFFTVAELYLSNPDKKVFCFNRKIIFSYGSEKIEDAGNLRDDSIAYCNPPILQQGIFYTTEAVKQMGELSTVLHYTMDYDWWLRFLFLFGSESIYQKKIAIANMLIHTDSKTFLYGIDFNSNVATILYSLCKQLNVTKYVDILKSKFKIESGYEFPIKINKDKTKLVERMLAIFLLKNLRLVFTEDGLLIAKRLVKIDWNEFILNKIEKKWLVELHYNTKPKTWILFRLRRKFKYIFSESQNNLQTS